VPNIASRGNESHWYNWQVSIGDSDKSKMLRSLNIGHMPLDSIGNLALKNLGATMVKGGLGASAIRSYTNAVKMVVASAVNEEGDALYPRKWNHEFVGLPKDNNPKQATLTGYDLRGVIVLARKNQHRMFFVLSASGGLRHGGLSGSTSRKSPGIAPPSKSIKRHGGASFTNS
jgi:hypothetical protein